MRPPSTSRPDNKAEQQFTANRGVSVPGGDLPGPGVVGEDLLEGAHHPVVELGPEIALLVPFGASRALDELPVMHPCVRRLYTPNALPRQALAQVSCRKHLPQLVRTWAAIVLEWPDSSGNGYRNPTPTTADPRR